MIKKLIPIVLSLIICAVAVESLIDLLICVFMTAVLIHLGLYVEPAITSTPFKKQAPKVEDKKPEKDEKAVEIDKLKSRLDGFNKSLSGVIRDIESQIKTIESNEGNGEYKTYLRLLLTVIKQSIERIRG